jgi:hypothetical protein
MRLSDNVISHIAQLLQLAIITGTDIVDNIRMIELVNDGNTLELDENYENRCISNIEKMLNEASTNSNEQ